MFMRVHLIVFENLTNVNTFHIVWQCNDYNTFLNVNTEKYQNVICITYAIPQF